MHGSIGDHDVAGVGTLTTSSTTVAYLVGCIHHCTHALQLNVYVYNMYTYVLCVCVCRGNEINKSIVVNPRHACAASVTVLCLFVCLFVCLSDTTLQVSVVDQLLKFRHQRSVDDTPECFDS